jgi:predicted nucleic acid-binding protein
MNIFLDTSSLIKLYHTEIGTAELDLILLTRKIDRIFLSELSKIEFVSTIWKKVRTKEIVDLQGKEIIDLFESDSRQYIFIATNDIVIEKACVLANKYGLQGLRTLDSIQLSTAVSLLNKVDTFLTSDKLLKTLFEAEGLATEFNNL